jgi:uncharacterized membrane protein YccF (DUF307 family)
MAHIAPFVVTILYVVLAIVIITGSEIMRKRKQNPYANIIPLTTCTMLFSMWILYMGAWLAQWHPLITELTSHE